MYARVGRKLIDSLRNETGVRFTTAHDLFPVIRPRGLREALASAPANGDYELAETRSDDVGSSVGPVQPWGGMAAGSRLVDSRAVPVAAPADAAFERISRIGGDVGWYYAN